jgi:hypothetical protein
MPNWCNNWVEVGHEDPAKVQALADAMNRGEFCNAVIPVPQELKDTVSGSYGDPVEQAELERKTRANVEKYGAGNWYDFCTSRWGTKWDVGGDGQADIADDGLSMNASFDSAWAPPVGVYDALVEQGYSVRAYYYESGMCYAGVYDNGSDDCQDFSNMTAKQVEDIIDPDLDECMGITEGMYAYEAENEEELTAWVREGAEKTAELKTL